MRSRGQVSLESLLIWAALAGVLALFTPVFAQTIHAYGLEQQTLELKSRAQQVQGILEQLAFEAEGSKATYAWVLSPETTIEVSADAMELRLDDPALANPKKFVAQSPLPLSSAIQSSFSQLIFSRTVDGITIGSQ